MAEIKWIKITTTMFDDEKLKLIDSMPERDTIFYIWIRLLTQAGKTNACGYIFLTESVPYTDEMLSTIFNRPLNSVRLALQTLKGFAMIDILDNQLIKITNWEKHQNVEGMEKVREQNRLRKQKERESKRLISESAKSEIGVTIEESHVMSRDSHAIEREEEREREEDKEEDIEKEREEEGEVINSVSSITPTIEICKYYEHAGFGTINHVTMQKLEALIEIYSIEWVKDAIDTAVLNSKYRLTYVEGILQNWKSEGRNKKKQPNSEHKNQKNSNFNNFEQRTYDESGGINKIAEQLQEKQLQQEEEKIEDFNEYLRKQREAL